ncbi:hypothetical protein BCIN_03g07270 [Botrytis cinerea B05.10]|uniref:Duf614 domain-containing protein n=3 Tax=Botryotinia fuckeliana TaxID=40559 RepID=A0A384JD59_BOTFB|nr:hypothetical protein BCIN_03g07270 [Botrytis cinerea B05.10]ATZ48526.1 hypothetical protein BCIN_03g07270 [Botrytis cinerea B05.10]EMR82352.1 putative duf614 domain-containing protein [Botrytis cinerea BcDW1]
MAPMTMAARREKRKLAKNPPVTKYNLDPTTPVHRQSLATAAHAPAMVEARQPAVTPQLRYAIPDQPQRSELSMNRNKSEHKGQSDWMVPFCHHPESDHTTALEGLFIPCLLYGKTHWRLKNVALGRDPHDFKPSDGCNSMCWIHGALTAACCLSIGLTLIQRARIRAQYRILGSMGNDVIKSCFCGPCVMMQHDREVRAREGASGLTKFPNDAQMSHKQPNLSQPMRYASQKAPSAENPGIENRIYNQGRRYTDSELREVPAVAILSTSEHSCQGSNNQSTSQHCEMEELKDHMLMEPHRRAINSSNAGAAVDGTTSSRQKTRVSSERLSLGSIASCSTFFVEPDSPTASIHGIYLQVKGCEKLSRMPARGNLSYVHDFSDYSATKIVLEHYAKEERRLQEKGTVSCLAHFSEDKENLLLSVSDDLVLSSTTSSSSSTVRQHTSKEDASKMPLSELVNPCRNDSCAESVDSAWLLDIPIQHRISSYSIIPRNPSSIRGSIRNHRITSCPATPGTPVISTPESSAERNRMLSCTVETAPPSSSPSPVLQNNGSPSIMDIVDDSDISTPLIQYSQYRHLLDENTLESGSPISRFSSRSRAFSCTALNPVSCEQHSLEGCSDLAGDCSPVTIRQHRISSCCASIPSGSMNQSDGDGSHKLKDCNFTTGSSTPVLTKPYRFASYVADSPQSSRKSSAVMAHLMEDGCLLSGVASPIKQHRISSCGGNASDGNSANNKNENGYMSSSSSTPNPRQHRAVSCIASTIISECDEHLIDDCEYDSKISSPLLQHNEIDCDLTSVSGEEQRHLLAVLEEEQEHLLEECVADSGPSTPLRQHRISSCVVSGPSSNRNSVVKQHRASSCPSIIPAEGSRPNSVSHDSLRLPRGLLVDTSDNDQSTHTNYEDCLHTLDECITPADRAKMEASASRDTEYEKYSTRIAHHFNDQPSEFNEKSTVRKEGSQRLRFNDFASHESDAQFTLAQVLSLNQESPFVSVNPMDGDGTMSVASRKGSAAPPVPFPSPAAPYPSPITPLNISGAYPQSITPLSLRKDKKRFPSEQSSAGSGFASYFGFGSSKKTSSGLIDNSGGNTGRRVESGSASRVRDMGLGVVELASFEELELEELLS